MQVESVGRIIILIAPSISYLLFWKVVMSRQIPLNLLDTFLPAKYGRSQLSSCPQTLCQSGSG